VAGAHGKRIKVFCFFFSKKKTCFLFIKKQETLLFLVTAQEGKCSKARKQESSFFEKKEAKKLFSGPAAPPEAATEPTERQHKTGRMITNARIKVFCFFFFKKRRFLLSSCVSPDLGSYQKTFIL